LLLAYSGCCHRHQVVDVQGRSVPRGLVPKRGWAGMASRGASLAGTNDQGTANSLRLVRPERSGERPNGRRTEPIDRETQRPVPGHRNLVPPSVRLARVRLRGGNCGSSSVDAVHGLPTSMAPCHFGIGFDDRRGRQCAGGLSLQLYSGSGPLP
jgi:hypothetical protein